MNNIDELSNMRKKKQIIAFENNEFMPFYKIVNLLKIEQPEINIVLRSLFTDETYKLEEKHIKDILASGEISSREEVLKKLELNKDEIIKTRGEVAYLNEIERAVLHPTLEELRKRISLPKELYRETIIHGLNDFLLTSLLREENAYYIKIYIEGYFLPLVDEKGKCEAFFDSNFGEELLEKFLEYEAKKESQNISTDPEKPLSNQETELNNVLKKFEKSGSEYITLYSQQLLEKHRNNELSAGDARRYLLIRSEHIAEAAESEGSTFIAMKEEIKKKDPFISERLKTYEPNNKYQQFCRQIKDILDLLEEKERRVAKETIKDITRR